MEKDRENRFPTVVELSDRLRKLKGSMSRRVTDSKPSIKLGRVVLVEDNEENRDMLARRLQKRGFEVSIASDGKEGIKKIVEEQPDLVLMDISLPVMDGFEASRQLKANPQTKNIP